MTPGQIAFDAYNAAKGGVTYDGKPIPPWSDVGDDVRAAWEEAAGAVLGQRVIHSITAAQIGSISIPDDDRQIFLEGVNERGERVRQRVWFESRPPLGHLTLGQYVDTAPRSIVFDADGTARRLWTAADAEANPEQEPTP